MAERVRIFRSIKFIDVVLASGEQADRGNLACIDLSTGTARAGQASTTLLPIGYFNTTVTGDGTKTVSIELFDEVTCEAWDNDTSPNAVAAANLFSEVYIKDSHTVSTSSASSTRSKAGRVIAIDPIDGIFVQAGTAVTGPTGATGTGAALATASRTTLAAIAAASRQDGQLVMVQSDGSLWRFVAASTLTSDTNQELVVAPIAGTGAWLRADKAFTMKLAIGFGTTDGASLLAVPAGCAIKLTAHPYWEVTTSFTGGSSSAIGVSSDVTGYSTAGDLLGGASGDVLATLAGPADVVGTAGSKLDTVAHLQGLLFVVAKNIKFNRITSAFTAGAGFVCVPVSINFTAAA